MIDDKTRDAIKRLRRICYSWEEISQKTGVPRSTCFAVVNGRPQREADRVRRRELRKRAETIRMLRRRVDFLERELKRREAALV